MSPVFVKQKSNLVLLPGGCDMEGLCFSSCSATSLLCKFANCSFPVHKSRGRELSLRVSYSLGKLVEIGNLKEKVVVTFLLV